VRALYRSVCGSFGMVVIAGTALILVDITAGSIGASLVETSSIDMSVIEGVDECMVAQICIDRYLWSRYEQTRKIDTVKVPEQIKVSVKRKGKTKIVTKTITKLVNEDFTWKDPKAAERAGMSPEDYVIGGMDPTFRVTLYHALRALDDAGLMPGITCAFRDDYRQTIASGLKAQSDRSYHGGSFRGGYGHGLAADIVSVKGETRAARLVSSGQLWTWIDTHEKELGIGRPYLDRDPPHVGPIDGKEYAAHRVEPNTQHAESKAKDHQQHGQHAAHHVEPNTQHAESKAKDHQQHGQHAAHHVEPNTQHAESRAKDHQRLALHNDHSVSKPTREARPSRAQSRTQLIQFNSSPSRVRIDSDGVRQRLHDQRSKPRHLSYIEGPPVSCVLL
jgi:hypothetical protein